MGRAILFATESGGFVPNDNNDKDDLFYHDVATGITSVITPVDDDLTEIQSIRGSSVSEDGRYVTFSAQVRDFNEDGSWFNTEGVFLYDHLLRVTNRLTPARYFGGSPDISDDGQVIAFLAGTGYLELDLNNFGDVAAVFQSEIPDVVRFENVLTTVDPIGHGAGQLIEGPANAFDGINRLMINGNDYTPTTRGTLVDAGHTIQTAAQTIDSVIVSREVTGVDYENSDFIRTVEVLENPTDVEITIDITLIGNLGSGLQTNVFATGDGDLQVEVSDHWFGTDDSDASDKPAIIHVFSSPGGLSPNSANLVGDNLSWNFQVSIPPGQVRRLASLTLVGATQSGVIDSLDTLFPSGTPSEQVYAFLNGDESESILNFLANDAPIAHAGGPYAADEGSAVTLTGSATVDTITPNEELQFDWDFNYDESQFDVDEQGEELEILFPDDSAARIIAVRVTDPQGLSAIATTTLEVFNVPVEFDAGPDEQLSLSRNGTFSRLITFADPGADDWSGIVDFGDGSVPEPLMIDSENQNFDLSHTFSEPGTYSVDILLEDGDGGSQADQLRSYSLSR